MILLSTITLPDEAVGILYLLLGGAFTGLIEVARQMGVKWVQRRFLEDEDGDDDG